MTRPSLQNKTRVSTNDTDSTQPATGHSLVTLLLVIHWFVIATVLLANTTPRSYLLDRLTRLMRPYAGVLHLDPDRQAYCLTFPSEIYDDHVVDVFPVDRESQAIVMNGQMGRFGPPGKRHKSLAKTLASFGYAQSIGDAAAAEIAKNIAAHVMQEMNWDEVIVRCRRHRPAPREVAPSGLAENPSNPHDLAYFEAVYQARVLRDAQDNPIIIKLSNSSEVATPSALEN